MERHCFPVTPAAIGPELRSLCDDLVPGGVPDYIEVHPAHGTVANACFPNVRAAVDRAGGQQQFGWSLWEFPGLFVEAEVHSISVPPGGAPVDITAK